MNRHLFFQYHITAGYNDRIVDRRTHLDCGYNQVRNEKYTSSCQRRHREIDPDTSLNGQYQQNRESGGLECEQQNNHNKQRCQYTDNNIICCKRRHQVMIACAVTNQYHV